MSVLLCVLLLKVCAACRAIFVLMLNNALCVCVCVCVFVCVCVCLFCRAGASKIFGYTAAEIIGKPMTTIFPEDRYHEEAVVLEKIRRGERIDHFETVRRHKDGRLIDISTTISPIVDEMGTVIGASKVWGGA